MKIYQFNALTDPQKAQEVLKHGNNLKTRKDEGLIINLYSLSNFYIEVWYDEASKKTNRIRSFKNIDHLGPYIDDIGLGGILKPDDGRRTQSHSKGQAT